MGRTSIWRAQLAIFSLECADVRSLACVERVSGLAPSDPCGSLDAGTEGVIGLQGDKAEESLAMHSMGTGAGTFVISLDYELMWGVRDHATRESYGSNVLGGREAIPVMLELFEKRNIQATWAIVGALLCES